METRVSMFIDWPALAPVTWSRLKMEGRAISIGVCAQFINQLPELTILATRQFMWLYCYNQVRK
jgi:hypothetical protein